MSEESSAAIIRALAARDAIAAVWKTLGRSGRIKCPNCGGILAYAVRPPRDHIWLRCETPGCVSLME